MNRRISRVAVLIATMCILILASYGNAEAQINTTYTQYKIQLNSDGSASWVITQVSGLNGTVDTWSGFQEKITSLIAEAAAQTSRPMQVDNNSLEMSTILTSSNSKTTNYDFTWLNFSVIQNNRLTVGDVFNVEGFFNQLYGDGELQINYPANYTLLSVNPTPNQNDSSSQSLLWLGTQFFVTSNPLIVFEHQQQPAANSNQQEFYLLLGSVSAVVIAAILGSWFFLTNRRHKQRNKETSIAAVVTTPQSEEDKVILVLRNNGGTAFQSAITEKCRFSKAKTSQLLTSLEKQGIVRRYKKGRDKVVILTEQAEGEK